MKNDIHNSMFANDTNFYNNFQKLRYHGLVYYARDENGQRVRGHWLITRNGWAFLRGEIRLPKHVLVKNNHIVGRSDEDVSMRDVYVGAETMQTTFEYFDEDGRPVGIRPHRQSLFNQIGLQI